MDLEGSQSVGQEYDETKTIHRLTSALEWLKGMKAKVGAELGGYMMRERYELPLASRLISLSPDIVPLALIIIHERWSMKGYSRGPSHVACPARLCQRIATYSSVSTSYQFGRQTNILAERCTTRKRCVVQHHADISCERG